MSSDMEQKGYKNPMCGGGFEELWGEGMRMAGRGDVRVIDAGDGSGSGYLCSVKSRTRPGVRHRVQNTLQKGRGHASVPCMKKGASSVRI